MTLLGVRPQCLLIISLKMKFETDWSNSSQCGWSEQEICLLLEKKGAHKGLILYNFWNILVICLVHLVHKKLDINFGNRLYSKEKRPGRLSSSSLLNIICYQIWYQILTSARVLPIGTTSLGHTVFMYVVKKQGLEKIHEEYQPKYTAVRAMKKL